MTAERDAAKAQRDAERDAAKAQRDAAKPQRTPAGGRPGRPGCHARGDAPGNSGNAGHGNNGHGNGNGHGKRLTPPVAARTPTSRTADGA